MFVRPVAAVVDLVTHLPLTDAAAIPTLELVRSTRRSLCGGGGGGGHEETADNVRRADSRLLLD